MKRSFFISLLWFFLPMVLLAGLIEAATRNIPTSYAYIAPYLDAHAEDVEVLLLGSSQMKDAIDAKALSLPALNLASGNQHHDTDFALLKQLLPLLPKVHTVVLEVSYSHFELPHNGPTFWKHAYPLHYYNVNAYQRTTYFKDELLFLANPPVMFERLKNHYITKEDPAGFNSVGFDTLNYAGKFQNLHYDPNKIAARDHFKINQQPNLSLYRNNVAYLKEMIAYLQKRNIRVVVFQAPMYKTYLSQRNPEILMRREQALEAILVPSHIERFNVEADTTQFHVTDYWNESHLNPDGAAKATALLNQFLEAFIREK
ncbi:hypothetical protein [Altibacter sp. HG106]|uniref:hypothetical protein n=1 Tax=Altibacter sp. HG106 TaxID=3023937 RepID=UPI002350FE10|nr:hypothetical protein [Altibacter sp. HG106]MDC7995298.1 hypothetical protein [Altibacter sp. HG106]